MKKISIIGSGGAGKSTLAVKLGKKLQIPVYHLDALYWKPGWVETEREKWRSIQEDLCSQDSWILDGNYGATLDVRLKSSDTIIFLDINPYLCLARVIWRSIRSYGQTRSDMAEGCREQFDLGFYKWILNYPVNKKPGIMNQLKALPRDKKVIVLNSPSQVKRFLENA